MPLPKKQQAGVKKFKGEVEPEVQFYIDQVDRVRESKNEVEINIAFNLICEKLDSKIRKLAGRYRIPGYDFYDVFQECLMALRYKAIKDYDIERGKDPEKPAKFDHFAMLCIRRHLATTLKTSKQNRHRAISEAKSLDLDRSTDNEELALINIVCSTEGDILSKVQDREQFKTLTNKLLSKLSEFEKQVFYLYARQYTYEQVSEYINNYCPHKDDVNIKGIDNALSRIKNKAKSILNSYLRKEERKNTKKKTDVKSVDKIQKKKVKAIR